MKILPLTGLPRTGSTLLLYILKQNPSIEIGPDSEISNLLYHNKKFIQEGIRFFQLPHEKVSECFYDFCREGTKSWVEKISDPNKIFVDKSRSWMKDLDFIFNLFPDIKILVTIRDLRGILNSFEKINNNSLFVDRQQFHVNANYDIQQYRISSILNEYYVKDSIFSLKELIDIPKKYNNQIYFSRYEDLIKNPQNCLNNIYKFLEIPSFIHNFNNINQEIYYDNPYQPYGCHKIKNSIQSNVTFESFSNLREDIQNMILQEYHWYYKYFYPELI